MAAYPSLATCRAHFGSGCTAQSDGVLLPLRFAAATEDVEPVLGFQLAQCGGQADGYIESQHLSAIGLDRGHDDGLGVSELDGRNGAECTAGQLVGCGRHNCVEWCELLGQRGCEDLGEEGGLKGPIPETEVGMKAMTLSKAAQILDEQ